MRVAIVHDWLTVYGGAERVLEQILQIFPSADLFSVVDFFDEKQRKSHLQGKRAKTTFIQRLPFSKRLFRNYLPLMPLAIEQLDLREYDLVISSSFSVAKGVITGPSQLHICYCHSPARYLWDLQAEYLNENSFKGLNWLKRLLLHKMRGWDYRSAQGVDHFIANSQFVARRIEKFYGRESTVIYPPVDTESFIFKEKKEDFYLTASRLVAYKKVGLIIEAFCQMPEKKLVVMGEGPQLSDLKKRKLPPNILLMGKTSFSTLSNYMQRAKAFVFCAIEDFGIAPVEALACGTPVIAYNKGGALETVRGLNDPCPTGCFFDSQSAAGVMEGVLEFEKWDTKICKKACRTRALAFSKERFKEEFASFIGKKIESFFNEHQRLKL